MQGNFIIRKYNENWDFIEEVSVGNGALNTGINELCRIHAGLSANTFSAANTSIGVGDSNTAFNATQTDLQGATKFYKACSTVTTGVNGGTTTTEIIVAVFGLTDAVQSWQEFVWKQTATSNICLNRAVSNQGTKPNTQIWTVTLTITYA